MSLENWLANRWLKSEPTSAVEIASLFAKIDRDIADAGTVDISDDWRLAMAYNACLGCATIALRCYGYRVSEEGGHHFRTIDSLRFTLGPAPDLLGTLQAIRKKRHMITYDSAGTVSQTEVNEILTTARDLRQQVSDWVKSNFPNLLP